MATPKEKGAVKVFTEGVQIYKIYQLMLQGKSIYQIADELKTPEENIRRAIAQEKLRLTTGMQEAQEQLMAVTYARTEWLISKVFPVIEKQSEDAAGPDKNLLKVALDIMKFQNEVVNPKNVDKSSSDVVIHQTFVGGSAMYDEAMKEMQGGWLETIRVENEIPMQITTDPKMVKLEALAERWLPEGVLEDGDDTE